MNPAELTRAVQLLAAAGEALSQELQAWALTERDPETQRALANWRRATAAVAAMEQGAPQQTAQEPRR